MNFENLIKKEIVKTIESASYLTIEESEHEYLSNFLAVTKNYDIHAVVTVKHRRHPVGRGNHECGFEINISHLVSKQSETFRIILWTKNEHKLIEFNAKSELKNCLEYLQESIMGTCLANLKAA